MVRRRARPTKDIEAGVAMSMTSVTSNSVGQQTHLVNGDDAVSSAVAVANLLEEQYFASPKRKDCKLTNVNENLQAVAEVVALVSDEHRPDSSHNSNTNNNNNNNNKVKNINTTGKGKVERGGISGRNIGIPLATRSQTRTIENFFKANAAAKNTEMHINETSEDTQYQHEAPLSPSGTATTTTTEDSQSRESFSDEVEYHSIEYVQHEHEPTPSPPQFVLNGDDTNDAKYNSNETSNNIPLENCFGKIADFQTHRSTLRDSHSSHGSTTDNIFLQEPVLTLDIDKSPNQASSIKINKCFDVGAIFSSPPSNLSSCLLNGRFNQIVTLNGTSPVKKNGTFGYEVVASAGAINGAPLHGFSLDNDSSSCDSGVAFSANSLTPNAGAQIASASPSSQNRRRKPATPHRILCPSPIKSMPRDAALTGLSPGSRKVAAAALKDPLSPRKSHRQMTTAACKTRRRLNQLKEQTPYTTTTAAVVMEKHHQTIVLDDDDDDAASDDVQIVLDADEEFENVATIAEEEEQQVKTEKMTHLNGNAKSVLYSAKHPTARQNTTNNNSNSNINNASSLNSRTASITTTTKGAKPKSLTSNANKKTQSTLPLAATNGNRELTDFFPVRRSVRKTKTVVKEEMMRDLERAVLEARAEGLKIAHFENKGRGVVADRHFKRGEFVIEYVGDLISVQEAAEREKRYALDENAGCYMYYFKHKNQQYCIDATIDTGKFGRLVNHSRNGNLATKIVVVKQRPHLVLLAKEDIKPEEELTYDYGDRSKESLLHHPWLAF